jgi:membrane protease YdiL (CAAX protease family)
VDGKDKAKRRNRINRKQIIVFFVLLIVYAVCAFLTYALFTDQLAAVAGVPMPDMGVSNAVIGLANASIILVLYGMLGLAGYWFARKLELPGIFDEDGNWRRWALIPFLLGALCGLVLIIGDLIFAPINGYGRFPHPGFPLSILASVSAAIGEEIVFRGFVFGLWGLLLTWAFRRFNGRSAALWIANIIAALAFGAGHLGTMMALTDATTPADLNSVLLAEIFLLNGIVGLVAGQQYMKTGLIAAVGVHFWTDIFWHVLWGLFS